MKLPSDPRLPTFGGPDYAKSLYARLYALFRSIAQAVNGNADGIGKAATAAGTSVEPGTNLPETDVQAALARFALNLDTSDPAARALLLSAIVGSDVSTPLNVVAYGVNGNGSWVRFAGGLQVCWLRSATAYIAINNAYGSLYQGTWTWTFPAAFIVPPAVPSPAIVYPNSANWSTIASPPSRTAVVLRTLDVAARAADSSELDVIAVGMWK
jgi:hypothetical protein